MRRLTLAPYEGMRVSENAQRHAVHERSDVLTCLSLEVPVGCVACVPNGATPDCMRHQPRPLHAAVCLLLFFVVASGPGTAVTMSVTSWWHTDAFDAAETKLVWPATWCMPS
jgi:hypothetical protein